MKNKMKNKSRIIEALTKVNQANQDLSNLSDELDDQENEILESNCDFGFCFGEYTANFNRFTLDVLRELDEKSLEVGFVYISDAHEETFKSLIRNEKWNGWEMPYIHISDIEAFIGIMSANENPDLFDLRLIGETLLVHRPEEPASGQIHLIEPSIIHNEKWYYLGDQGLCFMKSDKKPKIK